MLVGKPCTLEGTSEASAIAVDVTVPLELTQDTEKIVTMSKTQTDGQTLKQRMSGKYVDPANFDSRSNAREEGEEDQDTHTNTETEEDVQTEAEDEEISEEVSPGDILSTKAPVEEILQSVDTRTPSPSCSRGHEQRLDDSSSEDEDSAQPEQQTKDDKANSPIRGIQNHEFPLFWKIAAVKLNLVKFPSTHWRAKWVYSIIPGNRRKEDAVYKYIALKHFNDRREEYAELFKEFIAALKREPKLSRGRRQGKAKSSGSKRKAKSQRGKKSKRGRRSVKNTKPRDTTRKKKARKIQRQKQKSDESDNGSSDSDSEEVESSTKDMVESFIHKVEQKKKTELQRLDKRSATVAARIKAMRKEMVALKKQYASLKQQKARLQTVKLEFMAQV